MKPKTWEWVARALFEAALIVFAVVLGFMVNAWREEGQARAVSEAAILRIEAELQSNRDAVAAVLPYHEEVAAALGRRRAAPSGAPLLEVMFARAADHAPAAPKGVGDLFLHDEAWTTALARDALAEADVEDVQAIAAVYGIASFGAQSTWRSIVEQLRAREAFIADGEGVAVTRIFYAYRELVSQEKFLLARYDDALSRLRAE